MASTMQQQMKEDDGDCKLNSLKVRSSLSSSKSSLVSYSSSASSSNSSSMASLNQIDSATTNNNNHHHHQHTTKFKHHQHHKVSSSKTNSNVIELMCLLCKKKLCEPKLLACLHSFCKQCLISHSITEPAINSICCPKCKQETKVINFSKKYSFSLFSCLL